MLKDKLSFPLFAAFLLLSLWGPAARLEAASSFRNEEGVEIYKIDVYLEKTDKKFDKGALNFVAGWTEIFRQPAQELKSEEKKNKILKFTEGFGKGVIFGITDMVGGLLNAVTAPFPGFEIPLPEGGVQGKDITGGEPTGFVPGEDSEDRSRY